MRWQEQLEHAARALANMSPAMASTISASCGVRRAERIRFRDTARAVARRFELFVLIEEQDGVATASFFREDRAEVCV